MRRTVPWISWDEWWQVKTWLLSSDRAHVAQGIQRVSAWRVRGRVPLAVDVTAALLETALHDPAAALFHLEDPAAAHATAPGAAAPPPAPPTPSAQQLRLQYGLTLVRMVNGIADAQQKGKVAVSVAGLAEAAGLPRLLVDLRHDATHNELPGLPVLHCAVRQALAWLSANYWQRQADHVEACWQRVRDLLAALGRSCTAAAAKRRRTRLGPLGNSDEDEEEEEDDDAGAAAGDDAGGGGDGRALSAGLDGDGGQGPTAAAAGAYQGSEGKKQRKQLLSDLRGLVPPPAAGLLVDALLEGAALTPPARTARHPGDTQQQRASKASLPDAAVAARATHTALAGLARQYPELPALLLLGAVQRLCMLAAAAASPSAAPPPPGSWLDGPDQMAEGDSRRLHSTAAAGSSAAAAAGGAAVQQQVQQLLDWVALLAPAAPAAREAAAAAAGGARPAKKRKAAPAAAACGATSPPAATTPAAPPQAPACCAPSLAQLVHLQHLLVSAAAAACVVPGCSDAPASSSSSSSSSGAPSGLGSALSEAARLLQAAAGPVPHASHAAAGPSGRPLSPRRPAAPVGGALHQEMPARQQRLLQQLALLAVPAAAGARSGDQAAGADGPGGGAEGTGRDDVRLEAPGRAAPAPAPALAAARQLQQRLLSPAGGADAARAAQGIGAAGPGAAAVCRDGAAGSSSVWAPASSWRSCPVGALPSVHTTSGSLPCLDVDVAAPPEAQQQQQQQQQQPPPRAPLADQHQRRHGQQAGQGLQHGPEQRPALPGPQSLNDGQGRPDPQQHQQQPAAGGCSSRPGDGEGLADDVTLPPHDASVVTLGCWRLSTEQLVELRSSVRVLL